MRKRLIAGNWKMNKLKADLEPFFTSLMSEIDKTKLQNVEVLFAVPFTLLEQSAKIASKVQIKIAAQNIHFEKSGAFTGEVSAAMLKDIGVTSTLIGHSERRQYFGETDVAVAKKVATCLDNQITPIACVGELREERENNETQNVIRRQVEAILKVVSDPKDMVIAYEPVWAIGTGLNATSAQAEEVHQFIRALFKSKYGQERADALRILYGGSANPGNFAELISQPNIDGGLIGGASLKPADFAAMINLALK